jgi:hypothetical protein
MWRIQKTCLMVLALAASGKASAQDVRRPYGPFDAIADGARSSELRQLSLINGQLDHADYLRSLTVPVAGPRVLAGDPRVVGVYPYGRRGLLGLRPQGYVVVRRAPIVVYRRSYAVAPPTPPSPLYADADRRLDDVHREIEQNLRPGDDVANPARGEAARDGRRAAARVTANEPEELPTPDEVERPARRVAPRQAANRGIARDIARDDRRDVDDRRRDVRVPPRPQPDPPEQPASSANREIRPAENDDGEDSSRDQQAADEIRGPLLQKPAPGTQEF